MPRIYDAEIKSSAFKTRLQEADNYSGEHGLDKWGTRILWIALTSGVLASKRYASKQNRQSPARRRFSRLLDRGFFSEDPEGHIWQEGVEPWESAPLKWFNTLVNISSGAEPPKGILRNRVHKRVYTCSSCGGVGHSSRYCSERGSEAVVGG